MEKDTFALAYIALMEESNAYKVWSTDGLESEKFRSLGQKGKKMKAAGIIRQVDDLGKISEKKRLTVHIYGSTDNGEEHRTIVEREDGKKIEYYFDGYEGINFEDIERLLVFLEIKFFIVNHL